MSPPAPAPSLEPPVGPGPGLRDRWLLDPDVVFLNHGSFGARTRAVRDAQQRSRDRFEARPVEFLDRLAGDYLLAAKQSVGAFLGMRPDDFGFVTNATDAVNAVLRSLRFEPGDEVSTTNHVYPAVERAMRYLTRRSGAGMNVIDVPLPCSGPEDAVTAVVGGLTERTRLLILDHVASPTAVRFPVEPIIRHCEERGIDVLVDGAHAPGMLDLTVEGLGAAYYTGNLHKWVCAPPGAAFLWVRPDRQDAIHPNVISHFLDEGMAAEFAWQGTRDISAWLAAADAIEIMGDLLGPESWPRLRRHNHDLATWAQAMLSAAWEIEPSTPLDGGMLGSMASLALPAAVRTDHADARSFQADLYEHDRIEVPIFEWCDEWMIRPSGQIYNTPAEYEHLAEAVRRRLG